MFQSLSDDDTLKPKLLKTAKKIQELSASLQHSNLRWLNKQKGYEPCECRELKPLKQEKTPLFLLIPPPTFFAFFMLKRTGICKLTPPSRGAKRRQCFVVKWSDSDYTTKHCLRLVSRGRIC